MAARAVPFRRRLEPLLGQRVVVVDQGSRCCKFLVAESFLGHVRWAHFESLELHEEGVLAQDEVGLRLDGLRTALGPQSLAWVLPQHRVMADVCELPSLAISETRRLVEVEATRLSGLSESQFHYGYSRLKPFGKFQNPCWLTLCRVEEVDEPLHRFAAEESAAARPGEQHGVCEVVTSAQALFVASRAAQPALATAALVDLGATSTVVAIMAQGQGVFATSFPSGSAHFTEALARLQNSSVEVAEEGKRSRDLLGGPGAVAGLGKAVEEWYAELRRSIAEWLADNPDLELSLSSLPVLLCGGGARQPGLFPFLNTLGSLKFNPWPVLPGAPPGLASDQFWVAYGAALQSLGRVPQPVSLLPPELRATRRRQWVWRRVQVANLLLLGLLCLSLGWGTAQKLAMVRRKEQKLAETQGGLETAKTISLLARRLEGEDALLRPVLRRQRQTRESLETLVALNQVHTNRDFWYVLFADPVSYFSGTTLPVAPTNLANLPTSLFSTNAPAARREFVVELCIPQDGDDIRKVLSYVVNELKRRPAFARVDALPAELKRSIVDPRVFISNHVFGVAMELASGDTAATPSPRSRPVAAPATGANRPAAAPPRAATGATNR